MHPCMFFVLSILFQHYIYVFVHGASFPDVFDGSVASSLLFKGLGTLQCGNRAKVVAWASMGHEELVRRGMFPSTKKKLEEKW